jgi:charged multivesicular body protein 1
MPKQVCLSDMAFDLNFSAKQFERESKKAMNEMEKEKKKAAAELAKGQVEIAKIYAENALRQKAMGINMIKLASKLKGVASQMTMAEKTKEVAQVISTQVPNIQNAMKLMDSKGVAGAMSQFEKICEDLQVKTAAMEGSLGSAAVSANPTEVEQLLNGLKDQQSVDVNIQMAGTSIPSSAVHGKPIGHVDPSLEKALQDLKG